MRGDPIPLGCGRRFSESPGVGGDKVEFFAQHFREGFWAFTVCVGAVGGFGVLFLKCSGHGFADLIEDGLVVGFIGLAGIEAVGDERGPVEALKDTYGTVRTVVWEEGLKCPLTRFIIACEALLQKIG